jgi:hypothetical protein
MLLLHRRRKLAGAIHVAKNVTMVAFGQINHGPLPNIEAAFIASWTLTT